MAIEFSPCTTQDIPDIMQLEPVLFNQPFTQEEYEFEIEINPLAHYYKFTNNDELIGYAGIQCIQEDAHLMTIGIKESYQNQGLGKILLRQLIEIAKTQGCKRMILEVATTNYPAYHLYTSLGFKKTRRRIGYYGDQDGDEMILEWS